MVEKYCEHLKAKGFADSTVELRERVLLSYQGYIGGNFRKSILMPEANEIEEYIKHLALRIAESTMQCKMYVIKSFYKYCVAENIILSDPTEGIESLTRKAHLPRYIPNEEAVEILLNRPDTFTYEGILDKAVFETLYSTAIRRKELLGLKISDVDFKEQVIVIHEGKGGRQRMVPVGHVALKALERYLSAVRNKYAKPSDEGYFFINTRGKTLDKNGLKRIFYRNRNASKLTEKITPHGLRHACALHMMRGGAPVEAVSEMLGHKRLRTTEIYTRLSPDDLKKAHKKAHPRG